MLFCDIIRCAAAKKPSPSAIRTLYGNGDVLRIRISLEIMSYYTHTQQARRAAS